MSTSDYGLTSHLLRQVELQERNRQLYTNAITNASGSSLKDKYIALQEKYAKLQEDYIVLLENKPTTYLS